MKFNDTIKSAVAEAVYHAWEMEQAMYFLTPKDKESLRQEIAADVNAYLAAGGTITVLPPGRSTNLDHDESWRSFSL